MPGSNNGKPLKGKYNSKSSFIKGIKQAQKRSEARDRQRQMIEAEKIKKTKKNKKNK